MLVIGTLNLSGQTRTKRKNLEAKRKALLVQIENNKQALKKAKDEENTSLTQLKVLGEQISTREQIIETVSTETFEISLDIANQQKVIESLKADIENLKIDYADYIIAAYKRRNVGSSLLYVFNSKDVNQAYKRLKYLNTYGNYKQKQAQLILNTQREMISALSKMIEIKKEKIGLIKLNEKAKKELVIDKEEERKLLEKVQVKVKDLNQKIASQKKAAAQLNKSIDNLIAKEIEEARKAEERKRAKAAAAAKAKKESKPVAAKTSTSYLSVSDLKLSGDFASNKGKLPWPVAGSISQTFGEHPHPTLRGVVTTNNGIDIGTVANAQVKPVFKGTVKAIFPIPGLEKVVLVNHGEYFTVYARLATVNVKIGQEVEPKDILGTVATNMDDGTNKLHFEIWKQRDFQNPGPWLRSK
ncbi:MAG: peptidoglycan DD-metalloendopeptidase family protein [Bacteroidia bacterium]|nr:peptidoglycan DD-metalloendopeptidase family protein [Bacteroidia bacterium]MCF8445462.1 peptidoglycan DD-metalloendopeptidase family protein [Bacteroidia bacterium]